MGLILMGGGGSPAAPGGGGGGGGDTWYIRATAAGAGDGTSWANAAELADLATLVAAAGAGDVFKLAADDIYALAGSTPSTSGRTLSSGPDDLVITGEYVSGAPGNAEITGNRQEPWSGGNNGPTAFEVGVDGLTFTALHFHNIGDCVKPVADIARLTIDGCTTTNVRRCLYNDNSTGAHRIDFYTVKNNIVAGFSKGWVRVNRTSDGLIEDNVIDSEEQDGDNFACGLQFVGNAAAEANSNITIRGNTISNVRSSLGTYWQGDGIATEEFDTGFLIEFNTITNCTDRGMDLKSLDTDLRDNTISDCKRNLGLHAVSYQTRCVRLTSDRPNLRGGTGTQAHICSVGAGIKVYDSIFTDDDAASIVYDADGTSVIDAYGNDTSGIGPADIETHEGGAAVNILSADPTAVALIDAVTRR